MFGFAEIVKRIRALTIKLLPLEVSMVVYNTPEEDSESS
jgi:hypothetical protein